MSNKTVYITKKQAKKLRESVKSEIVYTIKPEKVLVVKKYLDDSFKRGSIHSIGDDGYPKQIPIVGMIGTDGSILKNMTDKQLFYLLQDRFKNIFDDEDKKNKILKKILKDWFYKKISKEGLLSTNLIK